MAANPTPSFGELESRPVGGSNHRVRGSCQETMPLGDQGSNVTLLTGHHYVEKQRRAKHAQDFFAQFDAVIASIDPDTNLPLALKRGHESPQCEPKAKRVKHDCAIDGGALGDCCSGTSPTGCGAAASAPTTMPTIDVLPSPSVHVVSSSVGASSMPVSTMTAAMAPANQITSGAPRAAGMQPAAAIRVPRLAVLTGAQLRGLRFHGGALRGLYVRAHQGVLAVYNGDGKQVGNLEHSLVNFLYNDLARRALSVAMGARVRVVARFALYADVEVHLYAQGANSARARGICQAWDAFTAVNAPMGRVRCPQ